MKAQEPLEKNDVRRRQVEARKRDRQMRANEADPDHASPEEETELSDDDGPG